MVRTNGLCISVAVHDTELDLFVFPLVLLHVASDLIDLAEYFLLV